MDMHCLLSGCARIAMQRPAYVSFDAESISFRFFSALIVWDVASNSTPSKMHLIVSSIGFVGLLLTPRYPYLVELCKLERRETSEGCPDA